MRIPRRFESFFSNTRRACLPRQVHASPTRRWLFALPGLLVMAFGFLLAANLASADTSQIQYLSGTDKDNTVPWQFMVSSGQNAGIPSTIPVPSCWQAKGFGTYAYTQSSSGLSTSNSETGYYTNVFAVPSGWAGKRIFLVFEGVLTDTTVTINGQSVGPTHQGGYYEFRYDVTPYVVVGANTNILQVTVRFWSANSFVEGAEQGNVDYWLFAGIFRPVYLEAKPSAYIDYVASNPLANGGITVSTYLGGISNNYTVNAFVTDTNNVQLGNAFSNTVTSGATNVVLSAAMPSPNLWSTEFPTLYMLTTQLIDTNGSVVHTVTNQIGFRTVTLVANQGLFINGKKVVLRGICHHEEYPTSGRTTSEFLSSNDVAMIKDMNFNAVRLSHYPQNKTFLQECNRQGLYVFEEMSSYQFVIDLQDGIQHAYEMIRRDVNDPCIIAWDNGNEGGWNADLDGGNAGATNYFSVFDIQHRLVVRPGLNATFQNLFDTHYPVYSSFTGSLGAGKTAYMTTEIQHSIYDGGGGASLQDYWDAMRTAPNGAGMFTWSWDDAGVVRTDQGGILDVRDNHGPDGIVGPYREKEASYFSYKEIYNPVQITAPNPASFTGTLTVTNRFDFTDVSQCTFDWQLGWYADPTDPSSFYGTNALTGGFIVALDSRSFAGPSMPAQTSGSLVLPSFPANGTNYDALRLTATDPFGRNLYTWTWPLSSGTKIRDRILGVVPPSAPAVTAGTSATEVIVTNGPRVFHFSKTTGILNSLTVSNQAISFTNGPVPAAGSAWAVTTFTNGSDGTNYYVGINSLGSQTNAFLWTIRPDGWAKLSYQFWLTGNQSYIGINFNYPNTKVTGMNWLGQGPYRVYKNRLAGQEVFVHTKPYNDVWTGQTTNYSATHGTATKTQWLYPEFAGYHGQLYWASVQTTEQPITVVTPTTNLFFRILTPPSTDQPSSYKDAPFPAGGISLLEGIPAMGNKFSLPNVNGPSGQTNVATGLYTGEANFFFGTPPASEADRDGNGLKDSWELTYFGAIGQDPNSDPDHDGLSLFVENAFDLAPTNSNVGSPVLPHFTPGVVSPTALNYSVPLDQADFFTYTPQISGDLQTWIGYPAHPEYFVVTTTPSGAYTAYSVEPNLANWPGNTNQIFLRLQLGNQ